MSRSHMFPVRFAAKIVLIVTIVSLAGTQLAAAQTGADLAVTIWGSRTVRNGENITYTITATNIGNDTATGVELDGWVPDWFNFVELDCGSGVPGATLWACNFADVDPGQSVSMTITVQACCGEKHMFEMGWATATNDVNMNNNEARIKVNFTGPRH